MEVHFLRFFLPCTSQARSRTSDPTSAPRHGGPPSPTVRGLPNEVLPLCAVVAREVLPASGRHEHLEVTLVVDTDGLVAQPRLGVAPQRPSLSAAGS